jgi:hypothetical protein
MLETGTSGLMSGEGKRVGMQYDSGTAPFLDSTTVDSLRCITFSILSIDPTTGVA